VSVIDTATNAVVAPRSGSAFGPRGVAVTPDGSRVYVANGGSGTVSVIDTATNAVVGSPIVVGPNSRTVAVTPDGSRVYVANAGNNTVSVIDTATNAVIGLPIGVGNAPFGVAVTPDGSKLYVANQNSNTVSVIDTATNTVVATLPVGVNPAHSACSFSRPRRHSPGPSGRRIAPARVSLPWRASYGGMPRAAPALGYASVAELQAAIRTYCRG
jgi:YVTN family beta-propeller protein